MRSRSTKTQLAKNQQKPCTSCLEEPSLSPPDLKNQQPISKTQSFLGIQIYKNKIYIDDLQLSIHTVEYSYNWVFIQLSIHNLASVVSSSIEMTSGRIWLLQVVFDSSSIEMICLQWRWFMFFAFRLLRIISSTSLLWVTKAMVLPLIDGLCPNMLPLIFFFISNFLINVTLKNSCHLLNVQHGKT